MVSKAELRFGRWFASIERPPREADKQDYISKIKADPRAVVLPDGWIFAGPMHDPLADEWTDTYEVLHDSGKYRKQLVIDKMAGRSTHDEAMRWARDETRRGTDLMQRRLT